jgi:hypothetical protein
VQLADDRMCCWVFRSVIHPHVQRNYQVSF